MEYIKCRIHLVRQAGLGRMGVGMEGEDVAAVIGFNQVGVVRMVIGVEKEGSGGAGWTGGRR